MPNARRDYELLTSDMPSIPNNYESSVNFDQVGRYNNRNTVSSVPIHKWNWKFSADKDSKVPEQCDLAAFLKKLELYRQAERLSYEQIHQKFHYLIDGCVYEWYMQYRHSFANWGQLCEGLVRQFTTPLTHFYESSETRDPKTET